MNFSHGAASLWLLGCCFAIVSAQNGAPLVVQDIAMLPAKAADTQAPMTNAAPIAPTETSTTATPILRASTLGGNKIVAFISNAGQFFKVDADEGMAVLEGRQAEQNVTDTDKDAFVCNLGSVLIYSDEPCDDITVVEKTTNSTQRQQQPPRINPLRRRNRRPAQRQQTKRRRAQPLSNRRNNNKRNGQRAPLIQQQQQQLNKRRRKQQQEKQQQQQQKKRRLQTANAAGNKRRRKQPLTQQQKRRRQQHQSGNRRRNQQQRKQQQQKRHRQQTNAVLQELQQDLRKGQRMRVVVRRRPVNPKYPRWQWADDNEREDSDSV